MMPPSPDRLTSSPSPETTSSFSPRTRLWLLVALAVFAGGYLCWVRLNSGYLAGGSDSSGYLNIARLLRDGQLVGQVPAIPGLSPPAWNYLYQQPLGFTVESATGRMVPTYPVGFPLHLLVAAPFVSLDYAAVVVNVFLAAAAGALMFALGRQCGLSWRSAFAGAALLWLCPLFLSNILQPMSDACAMVWSLAAVCAALQSRRHAAWALAAGLAVAIGVLVRPTGLLMLLPVGLALGGNLRAWLALCAGGLPGAAFLAWYNVQLYGSALTTGYGAVESLFSTRHFPHNAGHIALWLLLLLSPFVVLPALGLPALLRQRTHRAGVLLLWITTITGFYVFYFHTGEAWWYLRFILPAFPAVIVAALLVIENSPILVALGTTRRWLAPTALALALVWEFAGIRLLHVADTKHGEPAYLDTVRWMQAHAPADAIVLQMQVTGCFTYFTHFVIVRWDILESDGWARLQAAARAQRRPIYATLFPFEEADALKRCASAHWTRVAETRHHVAIWRLDETSGPTPRP